MANTIKIKRNTADNAAPTTSEIAKGEIGFTEGTKKLFYRMNDDTILEIGGEGAFLKSNANDTMDGDLTITGDLTVQGTTTQVDSTTVSIADPLVKYSAGNTGDSVDSGFYSLYNDGADKYAGMVRDASDSGKFILFDGVGAEPTTTVNTSDAGFAKATLKADIEGNLSGSPTITAATIASDLDMNGTSLILDADGDTSITADTDDQIDFAIGGTDEVQLNANALSPSTTGGNSLGTSSLKWNNLYVSGTVDLGSNVTINGASIDGASIGGASAGTGAFTSLSASGQFTSTVTTGTSPMVIASTTAVTNLNADMLDGQHAPSGTIVGTSDSQTLTNKTLTSAVLTTPQINDSDSSHQYIFASGNLTSDITINLPALTSNDTFIFADATQTLDNKTIDCGTY